MRNRLIVFTAALLLVSGAVAVAQQDVLPSRPLGSVDFGLRFTDVSGDQARFQRFRDLGDGGFLDRFRWTRTGEGWAFDLRADHVGRLDQRYFGQFQSQGKIKLSFQWDQVPLFYSRDTKTLYTSPSPGVLRISDSIRQGIQNKQFTLADVAGQATLFNTKSRRDTADFNLVYSATRDLDVKVGVKYAKREGTMPWGASFGFNDDVEVAAPVDMRTTDVKAGVEWANQQGTFRVGYDGSWFDNKIQTLTWDNPLKFTDSTYATAYADGLGTSKARMALWPSSTLHSITTAGSLKLPAHSYLTANVAVGTWNQNEALLPFTINTAIPVIPLDRATADAKARTLAMNYTFTSRPSPYVWLNARYRYYDFNNRTPRFHQDEYVRLDQVVEEGDVSEPLSSTRHNFDVDASLTPLSFTAFKIGYGREVVDRTFRIFGRTTDDVFRASIDTTGNQFVTLRAIYEHARRKGSGLDLEHFGEMGEQLALRHYDIADRDRNRVSAVLQVTPIPALGLSATVAAGKDDYKNSGFGLRDNTNRAYTFAVDVVPKDEISFGLSYAYERFSALQNSRNASPGPQFDDPRRNWSIDSGDRVHTINASFDLLKVIPKTELRFGYDFTRSRALYVYGVAPNSTLVAPQQLPPVKNELQTGTADLRYFLTTKLAVGFTYWYTQYRVDDFGLGTSTISRIDLPGSLFLGYVYRPYTANSAWVRLMYLW